MNILTVNTNDKRGGAAKIAYSLHDFYRRSGQVSRMVVKDRNSDDPDVISFKQHLGQGGWPWFWWRMNGLVHRLLRKTRLHDPLRLMTAFLANPGRRIDSYRGREDFRFPGSWKLLEMAGFAPDILHIHNMHGGYFDLRALPFLTGKKPVVITLHDMWPMTGHCAHSFGCDRWVNGCGRCPDLTIYPAMKTDATPFNWYRKGTIFSHSDFYVAAPCNWLMKKVSRSIMAPGVIEKRVITHGVDLKVFHPGDKIGAKKTLGIQPDSVVLLALDKGLKEDAWSDFGLIQEAAVKAATKMNNKNVVLILLGREGPPTQIYSLRVRYAPYQSDPNVVALHFQAADVCLHAARAETFPNTLMESLACGTPVVTTSEGGIAEMIQDGQNGLLSDKLDPDIFSDLICRIINNDALKTKMASHAAADARARFDIEKTARAYLDWFEEIEKNRRAKQAPPAG